jgi:hypothetical protein
MRRESHVMDNHTPLVLPSATVHNLKNQLGVVLGFVELLIEDTPEADTRRADLVEVYKAAKTCIALIERQAT